MACAGDDSLLTRIEVDGLVMDRFDRTEAALEIEAGKLVWHHHGQTFSGPLPGTVVCGPRGNTTLAQSPEARVHRRGGRAEACDAVSGRTLALGDAAGILDVTVAGRYAAVHRRTAGAQTLTAYDLREARAVGGPARASRMTAIALGDSGIGAYVSPEGAGGTLNGTYPGTAGPYRYFVRVLGSLVVWGGDRVHLRRATDTPVGDGRVWTSLSASLSVVQGQLADGTSPATVLGPIPAGCADPAGCSGVTSVGYGGGLVGRLERGVLTVRAVTGATSHPCPPPVHDFTLDYPDRVTCS